MNKIIDGSLEKFNNIKLPDDIDDIIEEAIDRNTKEKWYKSKLIKRTAAVLFIFTALITSVNMFPSFANTLKKVPFISSIVDIFKFDRGIENLYEKGCITEINKSSYDKGIKFTVNKAIMDKKRLIIAYTIEGEKKYKDLFLGFVVVQAGNDKFYQLSDKKYIGKFKDGKAAGILEVLNFSQSNSIENTEHIKVICSNMYDDNNGTKCIDGDWTVSFNLDKNISKLEPKIYNTDSITRIEDYEIKINSAKVYPSITEMQIQISGKNIGMFTGFKNMHLEDEIGNKYDILSVHDIYVGKNRIFNIDFESSYFSRGKELHLVIDGIYIDNNNKKNIVLSLKDGKLIDNAEFNIEYLGCKDIKYEYKETGEMYNKEIYMTIKDKKIVKDYNDMKLMDIRFPNIDGIVHGEAFLDKNPNKKYSTGLRINNITMDSVDLEISISNIDKDSISTDIIELKLDILKLIEKKSDIKIN